MSGGPNDEPRLAWDGVSDRIRKAESRGFSGSVLLVRDGEIVHDAGYGLANRDAGIECTPTTIYGIGSTPIDFTHVGILLLAEQGELSLDDPITRFFDGVPPDKRGITIEHLMTGASGLRDFHDLPSDRDPDHAWIDRDEAVRRILDHDLLFEPGTGDAHSHSAWGLLAAIIEVVSGERYPAFCRSRIFEPLGMSDTGFYGEPIPQQRLAIGYGERSDGETNAPPWWGPTSWLVMGSGGMTSTTHDLHRFHTGLREGKVLSDTSVDRFFGPPGDVLAGGSMYGYEVVYTQGPGTAMYVFSNAGEHMDVFRELTRDLAGLVGEAFRPAFSLGIRMEPVEAGVVLIGVGPGSAAARDGLRVGDVLESANGRSMRGDPMEAIGSSLRTGEAIDFVVVRDGRRRTVRVTPDPR